MNNKQFPKELFTDKDPCNHGLRHPNFLHFVKQFVIVEIITIC